VLDGVLDTEVVAVTVLLVEVVAVVVALLDAVVLIVVVAVVEGVVTSQS